MNLVCRSKVILSLVLQAFIEENAFWAAWDFGLQYHEWARGEKLPHCHIGSRISSSYYTSLGEGRTLSDASLSPGLVGKLLNPLLSQQRRR